MNWREIGILYRRELRSALRERSIILYSVVLPIVMYPVMLWAMFSGYMLVEGMSEGFTSRVALYDVPEAHALLRDSIVAMENVEIADDAPATPDEARVAVQAGELDAALILLPAEDGAAALETNFAARVTFDQSEERSRRARTRLVDAVDEYRDDWLASESQALGIPPEALAQFTIRENNVASGSEIGAFILSLMVPFFLVIMVAMGCFYPAVDSTAGERERSTWETLMTVSASRTSVLVAKYLYVATMGMVAGLLNVGAMVLTAGAILAPLAGDELGQGSFAIPALAVVVLLLGAASIALLLSALMMILASFARTFKDGQAMIQPAYFLAIAPILFVGERDIVLDARMAAVPIGNLTLAMRDAIQGIYSWIHIGEALVVTLALVVASLALARWILGFEDLLMGSYNGNFWKFIKERGFGRTKAG